MSNDANEYRYLFLVRQRFGEVPTVDSFYQLQLPAGLTGDQAKVMTVLNADFCKEELTADTQTLFGMDLRLRANSDMFNSVCLVRTTSEIDADDLDIIIANKHSEGELLDFLDESAIK